MGIHDQRLRPDTLPGVVTLGISFYNVFKISCGHKPFTNKKLTEKTYVKVTTHAVPDHPNFNWQPIISQLVDHSPLSVVLR